MESLTEILGEDSDNVKTAGAPGGTKSPGNTSTSGLSGSAGVSMPAEAKTPPTAQNKQLQKGEHPSALHLRLSKREQKSRFFFREQMRWCKCPSSGALKPPGKLVQL
ncbi:hypothetical protein RUM44_004245 [Polyplax serrata]|uniref:Uncharacterized protein n=1 Tax=Polyplax serrata TaxID=468196 RepID=A0ABR1B298_POLSC